MYQYGETVIIQPTEKRVSPSPSNESLDIKKPASRRAVELTQPHAISNSHMAVYSRHPEIVAELKQQLEQFRASGRSAAP